MHSKPVSTVVLANIKNVEDHVQVAKFPKDDGVTKKTVGDDWKQVQRSPSRQGASPGMKVQQHQLSFPGSRKNARKVITSPNAFEALVDEENDGINPLTLMQQQLIPLDPTVALNATFAQATSSFGYAVEGEVQFIEKMKEVADVICPNKAGQHATTVATTKQLAKGDGKGGDTSKK